ncbi:uncharacterized protein LOC131877308 isoform X2 [Tigriopus californicus]|uniref:uncharacterized protein LOC131877308 isoform X2 n=1 Tax=Tigriopus californicus TaxID=6832 RepID=UPI0027DA3CC2|nr:uncharacterized protein LOC131877308 isoform X2 [Tigriopus californicus]
MSKTQFIELLEKQEEAENRLNDDEHDLGLESNSFGVASSHGGDSGQFLKFRQSMPKMSSAKSLPRLSGASRRASSFVTKMNRDGNTVHPNSFNSRDALLLEYNDSKGSPSYLDQEAKMSFEDLKQKCTEMGLVFPASDWEQLKLILAQKTGNASFDLQSDTDYKVKNDDFFDALQKILKNHLKRRPLNCGIPDDVLKDSMKSDSGGEMESCRSSDSGLERELAEKEREICERDRELSTCYRNLAERDTELVRVRMECQRLLENNRELRDQIRDLKLYSNPRRHFELEKEVEHLKWHLDQMESSRNVYALGTSSLVTFLEEITAGLHATSPAHRKLIDATKEELSRVTRRTKRLEIQQHGRRSLDGNHSLMSRAESMPGLNLDSGLSSSQVSLISTSTTGGAGSLSTGESATLHRRHVQRSQSTNSKRSQKLPSLQENANDDEDFQPYENHSIIQRIREETAEELQNVHSRPKSQTPASRSNSSQRADSTKSTKPQKRHSFALRSTIPSSEDEAPRPMKPSNDQVTPRLSKKDKFKKSITASSDKDSGRCSLGSVSSGRSTPNLSHSTSGAPKNQSKDDDKPKDKFKSLGNIHMEPALPNAPISCAQEEHREQLLSVGKKFKRSMRNLVTRDTTLKITPKKNKAWRSSMDRNPPSLQLLSHTSFPGLPAFPMLAASHTSPWNC